MPLLPAQFADPLLTGPLGPVVKPKAPEPGPHVHDWRPCEGSAAHARCAGCGDVALRKLVMPPEPPVFVFDAGEADEDTTLWPEPTPAPGALGFSEVLRRQPPNPAVSAAIDTFFARWKRAQDFEREHRVPFYAHQLPAVGESDEE